MNHDYFNDCSLTEVCTARVEKSGRAHKAIAAEIGKSNSTLHRELDPNDEGGKIGVDTLLPLIRACFEKEWPPKSPPAPLVWLASKCGFKCIPLLAEPDHFDVREEILDDHKALCQLQEAIRKGNASPGEIAVLGSKAQREIEETLEQYRREWHVKNESEI